MSNVHTDLSFVLAKGEKIIEEFKLCRYAGVGYVTLGSGFGSASRGAGFGGGFFTSKQTKREGSIFDSKPTHIYLTNKRIVFCHAKVSLWDGEEKEVGIPFAEILPNQIRGITKSSKFGSPAIDIAILNQGNIDNLKVWFIGKTSGREDARELLFKLIKKLLE